VGSRRWIRRDNAGKGTGSSTIGGTIAWGRLPY